MKTCKKCQETKPEDGFYLSNKSTCRTCIAARSKAWVEAHPDRSRVYQREYRQQYRAEDKDQRYSWFAALKAAPCLDCKNSFPPECMDFDHIDRATKVADVSYMVVSGNSRERILKEISKCELVCANCHRIRTAKQLGRRGT